MHLDPGMDFYRSGIEKCFRDASETCCGVSDGVKNCLAAQTQCTCTQQNLQVKSLGGKYLFNKSINVS